MPYPKSPEPSGPVFTAPFAAVSIGTTGVYDLYCVTAPSNSRLAIREVRLGQFTDFADLQSEILSLTLMIGTTSLSSGGAAITPQNVRTHSGAPTAGSSVTGPSTTLASTTSAAVRLADTWNIMAGWYYRPELDERIIINPGERFVLRQTGVTDAFTMNGTLVIQEIGAPAST